MAAAFPRLRMPVSLLPGYRSAAVKGPWRGGEVCPLRARAESADSPIDCCSTCLDARAITDEQLTGPAHRATLEDLAVVVR